MTAADEDLDPPTRRQAPTTAPVPAPPRTAPGTYLGPASAPFSYLFLEAVGEGGEGVTVRARALAGSPEGGGSLDVAVKRHPAGAGSDQAYVHDLELQSMALGQVATTPHLVRTGAPFLGGATTVRRDGTVVPPTSPPAPHTVMSWVSGRTVPEEVDHRAVRVAERVRWIGELAAALVTMHAARPGSAYPVVHGDVKPTNCMITDGGTLVLVDLGAAHHLAAPETPFGLHSADYAAPEVLARPRRRREPSSDVFSLGATAYFLLTGAPPPRRIPTDGDDGTAIDHDTAARAIRRAPLLARTTLRSRTSAARLVLAALADDPADRPTAVDGAWVRQLRTALTGRPRLRAAGAGVLVLLLAGGAWQHTTHGWPFPPVVDVATRHVRWDWSPVAGPAPGVTTTSSGMTAGSWATAGTTPGTVRFVDSTLELAPSATDLPVVVAPGDSATAATPDTVRATADVLGGQGQWGVWCRGSDTDGTLRYRFLLSHAGAVQISTIGVSAAGDAVAVERTPSWYLDGLDLSGPVTVEGRCEDTAEGQVTLTMVVQGRVVLTHVATGNVLGPGLAGVEAVRFADLDGPALRVAFSAFETSTRT